MSALATIYIKAETLKTLLDTVNVKKEKGVELTIAINDTTNDYGQNVSSYVSQTKEAREAKKPKFYTGNGKVFWMEWNISVAAKTQPSQQAPQESDDLPF